MQFNDQLIADLEKYGQVLSVRFAEEEPEPITFRRDREIELLERHIDQAKKNSFIVRGPSGCGKTAILYELFRRLTLRDHEPWLILETSTTVMMSGTVYIGEWQTRLQGLIDLAKREDRIAVFFNDVFNIVGAGTTSKSDENMGDALAPYVENGEFVLIGETTPDLHRKGVERFPKFKKLFQVFPVKEQPEEDVAAVIEQVAEVKSARVSEDFGTDLRFSTNSHRALQELGKLYFPGLAAPGGAIGLVDHLVNEQYTQLEEQSQVPDEIKIRYEDVIHALESFTGIPSLLLDDSQSLKLGDVRQFLESRVIGQSRALSQVVDVITLIKAGLTDPQKPMSVMFFVGPTGVGKTELAKALAEFIFGSPERMIRFDMSEFKDYHSYHKLIGDQNAHETSAMHSGTLLTKVRQQPFSVILLDEIEKAHPNIFDLLLQLFDDGRLTDPQGHTTNFTQTIIIMTSNLGSNLSAPPAVGFNREDDQSMEQMIDGAMKDFFRPEFLNRIDRKVKFEQLTKEDVKILAQRELGQGLMRSGITRRELRVDYDQGVIDVLVKAGFSELYGARPLKRAVENLALIPIARQIIGMTDEDRQSLLRLIPNGDKIIASVVKDRQTRKSKSLSKGVTVHDPVRGTKSRLKPRQLEEQLLELCARVSELELLSEEKGLEAQKSEYVSRSTSVDFWDHPEEAREILGEIYRLERLIEAVARVRKRTDDLQLGFEGIQREQNTDKMAEVASRMRDVEQHANLIRYSLQCRDHLDRCDAFVTLSTVDEELPYDLVGQMAGMYLNWAKLKGFPGKVLHEEVINEKLTREVTFLIEGVAIYGMLTAEEGIHEFIYKRTAAQPRNSYFVKVRVVPLVDDRTTEMLDSEVTSTREKANGRGIRCKRYKSNHRLMHQPTLVQIQGRNDLEAETALEFLTDWLRSEVARTHRDSEQHLAASTQQTEEAVRRYTMQPNQTVRDLRTDVATHNLTDLWNGEIDEFLNAAVASREKVEAEVAAADTQ